MKSIFTWHLFSFSKSLAILRKYSSEAATKWFQVSMVTVRVAAYSGGVSLRRLPARPPAVAPAAVRSTRRRLTGVYSVGRGSFVCIPVPYDESKNYGLFSGVESQYRAKTPLPSPQGRGKSKGALVLRFG